MRTMSHDPEAGTKIVRVTFTWKSDHDLEVPEDWKVPSTLDGFGEEALEEVSSHNAELVDWR